MERAILINSATGVDCALGERSTDGEEKIMPYVSIITKIRISNRHNY
jgi:hypothetical protein